MCCSRQHYPSEVGIHAFEDSHSHHHLILPGLSDVGICVNPGTVMWRGFSGRLTRFDGLQWHCANPDDYAATTDLIAMAIAEGGRLSRELVQSWLDEYRTGECGLFTKPVASASPWPIEVPRDIEWHEWLMHQATRELVDIQAEHDRIEKAMKEHLREALL